MKFLEIYNKENLFLNRNFGLDLIRSIAILLVLIAHFGIEESHSFGIKIGGLGVEIFFVLSGFLIGQILIKQIDKDISLQSIKNFWIRRWFRTLPLYYAVILLKFLFVDHSFGIKILVYFVFLQNNFVGIDFMPVTWSLVVEEWFYLILPILLFFVFYRRKANPKALLVFIIVFIVLINLIRFGFVFSTNRVFEGINGNFVFRLDSLMCGVLLAVLKIHYTIIYKKFTSRWVFMLILVTYTVSLFWFGKTNLEGLLNSLLWPRTIWFLLNSLFIAFLIPYIEINLSYRHQFIKSFISCISIFSYCAYLIHMEIYRILLHSPLYSFEWLMEVLLCLFFTFFISAFIYGIYEKPMTDIRERFKKTKQLT